MRKQQARSLTELPPELQSEILVRLPVKSLLLCKCVCKSLRIFIENPSFVQTHLTRITNSSTNTRQSLFLQFRGINDNKYDHFLLSVDATTKDVISSVSLAPFFPPISEAGAVIVVGSCNGLVLINFWFGKINLFDEQRSDHVLLLWNPVINQSRCLPTPHHKFKGFYEFGFIPETNEYVVLKVAPRQKIIEVYKMSRDSWTIIDCTSFVAGDFIPKIFGTRVFVNGSFHWSAPGDGTNDIVYFNLKDEKLGVIKGVDDNRALNLPDLSEVEDREFIEVKLAVVEQSLAMIYWDSEVYYTFEIWVMNEYGVGDSWALQLRIVENYHDYILEQLLGYWTNGLMVIEEILRDDDLKNNSDELNKLILYDVNTKSRMIIPRMEKPCEIICFCNFMETLVPIS